MQITKYEHSCLDIRMENSRLIIDPGKFTKNLTDFSNIDAVVVTHIHSDHLDKAILQKIYELNAKLTIFTTLQVANEIKNLPVKIVKAGDNFKVNNINLEFFGGEHEFYNEFQNIAVLVNNELFHPGDSYTLPNKPIKILASPASAPWLRVKDAGQYIINCKPKVAFPIHNILLSDEGKEIHYRILKSICDDNKINWQELGVGESIDFKS